MTRFQDATFHDDGTTGGVVRRLNTVFKRLLERWGRDPIYYPDRTVTASFTFTETDEFILADTSGGSVVGTLPVASTVRGRRYGMKKGSASNTLTFQAAGSDLIDGSGTLAWTDNQRTIVLQSVLVTAPATYGWRAVADYNTSSGGVSDGDKGDVVVSGGGATWTIDADAVTYAKMQNVTDARLLGRAAGSAGDPQELTAGSPFAVASGALSWNPTASVDFNEQQAVEFVLENRTSDPGAPATGRIWLRTDL